MILSVSEVLEKTSEIKSFEEKVKFLQQNGSNALVILLRLAFDPSIKWLVPEGIPPYKPSEFVDAQGMLHREFRKLVYFIDTGDQTPNIRQYRRESMFIQFLETIDKRDADLIVSIRHGKMPYRTITRRLASTAFPGTIPPRNSEKEDEQEKDV